ncbi:hypothetical protein F4804DRAFT_154296 [Jackrogersella minutella]|nr:hypothetical protein F4804DRAFT_154296 [Jackrogersella minutella]
MKRVRVGFTVGARHFVPVPSYHNISGSQNRSWSSGPTHNQYAQASATPAGLATLGLNANPGDDRQYRRVATEIPNTIPEEVVDSNPMPVMATTVGEDETEIDDRKRAIDYGTVIIRPARAQVRLPSSWGYPSPGMEADTQGESSAIAVVDKGKGKAAADDSGEQVSHLDHGRESSGVCVPAVPQQPGGSELSSLIPTRESPEFPQGDKTLVASSQVPAPDNAQQAERPSRPAYTTPSPPLSKHSHDSDWDHHPAVPHEWLRKVNEARKCLGLRALKQYDVQLLLRNRRELEDRFLEREGGFRGTEEDRRRYLTNLRRALRGLTNALLDSRLHPQFSMSKKLKAQREKDQEAMKAEASGEKPAPDSEVASSKSHDSSRPPTQQEEKKSDIETKVALPISTKPTTTMRAATVPTGTQSAQKIESESDAPSTNTSQTISGSDSPKRKKNRHRLYGHKTKNPKPAAATRIADRRPSKRQLSPIKSRGPMGTTMPSLVSEDEALLSPAAGHQESRPVSNAWANGPPSFASRDTSSSVAPSSSSSLAPEAGSSRATSSGAVLSVRTAKKVTAKKEVVRKEEPDEERKGG